MIKTAIIMGVKFATNIWYKSGVCQKYLYTVKNNIQEQTA